MICNKLANTKSYTDLHIIFPARKNLSSARAARASVFQNNYVTIIYKQLPVSFNRKKKKKKNGKEMKKVATHEK